MNNIYYELRPKRGHLSFVNEKQNKFIWTKEEKKRKTGWGGKVWSLLSLAEELGGPLSK